MEDIIIRIGADFQNLEDALKAAGLSMKQFGKFAEKNLIDIDKEGKVWDRMTRQQMEYGRAAKVAAVYTKRFKMEWLSVMFTGMALDRVFGGLVRSQMELFGVTDMLSMAWTTVLMPVMELITPFLYKLIEFFMNLPAPIQTAIGIFVLLFAAIGTILTIIGQAALGIAGLATAFGVSSAVIIGVIGGVILVISGIVLIITGVVNIVKGKLEGIGLVIAGIGVILLLFIGWWALIPIAVGAAVYLIIKYWTNIKNFFINLWETIKNAFRTAFEFIKNLALKVGEVLLKVFSYTPIGLLIKGVNTLLGNKGGILGSFQSGGIVPETGPYLLHKGETVVPTSSTFSPSVSISGNYIHSEMDLSRIADEVNRRLAPQFERMLRSRGSI